MEKTPILQTTVNMIILLMLTFLKQMKITKPDKLGTLKEREIKEDYEPLGADLQSKN